MPTYYARKSGNIDATDVWATTPSGTAGAVTFASGDVLVANSFTVTVNVSANLGAAGEVRNDTTGGATAGGSFSLSNGVTLTANVIAGTATCVTLSGSASATIVGGVTGGTASSANGVNLTSSGTLNVIGNVTGGSGVNAAVGVIATSGPGVVNVTGNVTGGSGVNAYGVRYNDATGGGIVGNVSAGTNTNAYGVGVTGSSNIPSVTVTGNVNGSSSTNGIVVLTGTLTVVGTATGAANTAIIHNGAQTCSVTRAKGGPLASSGVGVSGSATGATTVEEIEYGDAGASPTAGPIRLSDKSSNVAVMYRFGTTKKVLVDTASTSLIPAASNVRSGVVYNAGQTTGTCAVPGASSVLAGVPVDNTVGTASVSSAAIQSACDAAIAAFSSGRLANVATVASTGQQIANAFGS
jgi:hypothetical protein